MKLWPIRAQVSMGGGGGYDFGHIVQQDFKASFLGYRTTLELLINKNGIKGC